MKAISKYLASAITTISIILSLSSNVYAKYENSASENSLFIKFRTSGILSNGKQGNTSPSATAAAPRNVTNVVKNGYGLDVSTSLFFNDYFAAEISSGLMALKIKNSALNDIGYNYNQQNNFSSKSKSLYVLPINIIAQYNIAPFGAIRPYVGAGVNGSYLFAQSKHFRPNNVFGPVFQVGANIATIDDKFFNINVQQYILKTKIKYSQSVVGANKNVRSKLKLNPTVISAGIGFKF